MAEDKEHSRVFVDVEVKGVLAVIDRENGLLFLGCTNGKLVAMEAESGKVSVYASKRAHEE